MITHIVVFKYRAEIGEDVRADHTARLRALAGRIPGLTSMKAGVDVVRSPRSYDAALVATFADRAALETYGTHPAHVPVAELGRTLCNHIVAVDFESDRSA